MSSWNPGSSGDDSSSALILLLLATVLAPFVLPGVLAGAERWLLEHHILVPASQALLALPWTHSGLDTRRLVILALILIGIGAASVSIRRKAADAR